MEPKNKVIEYLLDAHSKETALVQTLTAHVKMAQPGTYRYLIEEHRDQTIEHARLLQDRLQELDGHRKPLAVGFAAWQNILTNTMAMAKAPVDMVRGKSPSEKMLKNARDEAMTEAAEIACYDSIERLAEQLGDNKTAELARRIRRDEETMLASLRDEIRNLTDEVIKSQLPEAAEPWAGYDKASAADINKRLGRSSAEEARKVYAYESAHKKRTSILKQLEKELSSV